MSSYGCWGSCYGCYGSGSGCWGSCYGCYGSGSGCWGSGYGCYGSCYGSGYGCAGCYGGGVVSAAPVTGVPSAPTLPEPKKEVSRGLPATVVVKAPADVHLTVNGQATTLSRTEETFLTPNLEPGHRYSYLFKAEAARDGKTVSLTRRVLVRAGEQTQVDLSNLSSGKELPEDVARVTVLVPADADLFIDGTRYPSSSERRSFDTPQLEPGRSYYYTLRAQVVRDGEPRTESQRVVVTGGKEVTVDFKDLRSEQAARR